MATLKELLAIIPDEYGLTEATITRIAADFGDKLGDLSAERMKKIAADLTSGKRDDAQVRSDLVKHVIGADALKERYGSNQDQINRMISGELSISDMAKQAAKAGTGTADSDSGGATTDDDPGTLPGVLAGGETIRVKDGEMTRWYQVYEFPPGSGSFVSYQFNDREQAEATLGEDFEFTGRNSNWYNKNIVAEADAEEVAGLEGTWTQHTEEVMRDAARAGGINDPSIVGRIASNKEMQELMAQFMIGDWTEAELLAAQRNTDFWKNELYPGIERFYGQTQSPERAWVEYRGSVTPALKQLGYKPDADGTMDDHIERMLDGGIDSDAFLSQVPTFIRATQNAQFAGVLDQWADRELGRNVDFNDWFDLMAGESQPDLERVAERARLAYEADQAGSGVSDAQIRRLSNLSDLSDAQAQEVFARFTAEVLALGDDGLGRYNLSRDEVLSAAAGVDTGSKRSQAEVRQLVAKIAQENDLFDDEKASFYTGFTPEGRPVRPGLQSLAPESA